MSVEIDMILEAGVSGLSRLYAEGALTPVDVFWAYMSRVAAHNAKLNAFLFVDHAGAQAAARLSAERWRAGAPLSALDGAPIGLKANIAARGWPWHAGIAAYSDRVAQADAVCVARLRSAGAVLLGTLNMDEAALGATGDNAAFGRCRNPHDPERTSGGSSGGAAAAVAAGLCAAALGTDTLGSVRIPASYCGVFGHKPALGIVPTAGVTPLSWTLDTVGVLARSVTDIEIVTSVLGLAGPGGAVVGARLDGLTLAALDLSDQVRLEREVVDAFQSTLETARALGAHVKPIRLEDHDVGAVRLAGLLVAEVEGFVEHQAMLQAHPDGFSPHLRALFAFGARQAAPKLASAYRLVAASGRRVCAQATSCDAILTPTTPQVAFPFDAAVPTNPADFTVLGNLCGLASTAFPVGATRGGLPLSVQVVSESTATGLRVAAALAKAAPEPPLTAGL